MGFRVPHIKHKSPMKEEYCADLVQNHATQLIDIS